MSNQLKPAVSDQDHIQGAGNAAVEIVEFGDYQCPHCGAAYPVIKKIQKKFPTQIKFVFRNFPLAESHPFAVAAAVATEAAALQNKYWQMHDIILEHQDSLSEAGLSKMAGSIGLDLEQYEADIQKESLQDKLESDFESGIRSGVSGTPSFFVNGVKFDGGAEDLYNVLLQSSE